jgi:hypothetical protein
MDAANLIRLRFVHFHLDAMRIGPSVLTDSGDQPGDLDSWLTSGAERISNRV